MLETYLSLIVPRSALNEMIGSFIRTCCLLQLAIKKLKKNLKIIVVVTRSITLVSEDILGPLCCSCLHVRVIS